MQNSSVSAHIREHREKAGLTQAQLAEAVFATRQTVGNWERGATLPDIQSLQLLAGVFGVTVDELLGGDADELARDWFYRWVLTKVNWWRWGIVAVLLVCFVAMGMGATRSIA